MMLLTAYSACQPVQLYAAADLDKSSCYQLESV